MVVQIIRFRLSGLSDEEFRADAESLAPTWADLPGLVYKTWLANSETNTYGGVYLWRDRAAMEAYLASELFKGFEENAAFVDASCEDFELWEGPSAVTRSPIPAAA